MSRVKLLSLLVGPLLLAGCELAQNQLIAAFQHPLSQPLIQAAGDGDVAEVDRLLAAGAPLEDPHALQAAVLHRQYGMVERLVGRGAPANGDGKLQSPLWFAVAHGDTLMAALLISLGADVDWQTDAMGSPLHAALYSFEAQATRLALARLLVERGADVNARQRYELFRQECLATPLHAAVFSLDRAAVELLIARGADRNATDEPGRTPLQCARERLETIRAEELRPGIEDIVALLEADRAPGA